jgi:uncharacterized protein (TIGR02453 family)
MSSPFTPKTLSFLRSLARNNDREWFRARRDQYHQHVHGPMVVLVERLAADFRGFAPELEASPKESIYRIYRDTRFSEDKSPLKTQVAASFRRRGLPRGGSAGLYVEVHPRWTWMGGGLYAPETAQLVRIRQHIADTHPQIARLTRARAFRNAVATLDGERLTRVPRGFASAHPAAEYLKYRNFLAGREFPAEFATSAEFYPTLVATFKAVMPLIRFLNQALLADGQGERRGLSRNPVSFS